MPNPLFETRLDELDIAVFDLETTGFFPAFDRIIQIAFVPITGGQIEDEANHREWKVNPGEDHLPLEDVVEDLTGLTTEVLREQRSIGEVLPEFAEAVGRRVVAGHNVKQFDIPFVRRAEQRVGIDVQTDYYIDTLKLARKLQPELSSHKLSSCALAYGLDVDEESLHDALVDTRLCAQVLLRQIADLAGQDVLTFGDMIDFAS
jgi:DNA polymerase III epsilon subunit-like protein